jgi:hypothetical protein
VCCVVLNHKYHRQSCSLSGLVDVVPVWVVQSRCRFARVVVILAVGKTLLVVSDGANKNESRADKTCPKDEAHTRPYCVVDGWVVHVYKLQGVPHNINMTFVTQGEARKGVSE